ncbi:ZIP family metal transporter [Herbaspirillum lusitanum]|uniref:ZIP family metal transporter n=1 Tax=Herbaspirillum lusitanum TaxID=213312 RepID=UPI000314AAD1|nr:ZIP family metal transporter [Herbaspirillum lusitanum]
MPKIHKPQPPLLQPPATTSDASSEMPTVEHITVGILFLCLLGGVAVWLQGTPPLRGALLGGAAAALATASGTIPVALSKGFSRCASASFLGFGAGVMLAASTFSLIIPALEAMQSHGVPRWESSAQVALGVLLGAGFVLVLDRWGSIALPGLHSDTDTSVTRKAWLFVLAVALHNIPEGMAIGVGYAGIAHSQANTLAAGIAIQDIPEGLVVATALRSVGYRKGMAISMGVLSGVVEPIAAVLAAAVVSTSELWLPWGLAGAAGAMLFVIAHDVIPEAHRDGHHLACSCSIVGGFILMMLLDTAL